MPAPEPAAAMPSYYDTQIKTFADLAKDEKGLKIGAPVQINGKLVQRYVFAKDTTGSWVNLSQQLASASPETIQAIAKLAHIAFEAHRTTEEKKNQLSFADRMVCHFEKEETQHKEAALQEAHQTAYIEALGGIRQNMHSDHHAILNFAQNPTDSLSTHIRDPLFIELFNDDKTTAFSRYVEKTIEKFLAGVNEEVLKELSQAAHKRYDPSVNPPSEAWLKDKFDDPKYAEAVFQVLCEEGKPHLTAHHAFAALLDKVQEAWNGAKRAALPELDPNSIVTASVPIEDLTPPIETSASISDYAEFVDKKRTSYEQKLFLAKQNQTQLETTIQGLRANQSYRINPAYWVGIKQGQIHNQLAHLEGLKQKNKDQISDLEKILSAFDRLDLSERLDKVGQLKAKIHHFQGQLSALGDKWTRHDAYALLTGGRWTKQQIQVEIEFDCETLTELERDIQKDIDAFTWSPESNIEEVAEEKMDAVYIRLQRFNRKDTSTITPNFEGAAKKLEAENFEEFSDEELKALSLWKPEGNFDSEAAFLAHLTTFLRSEYEETPDPILASLPDDSDEGYHAWQQKAEHFAEALEYKKGTKNADKLSNEAKYALKLCDAKQNLLESHYAVLAAQEAIDGAVALNNELPVSAFEVALTFLNDPTHALTDEGKQALFITRPTVRLIVNQLEKWKQNLQHSLLVTGLDLAEDTSYAVTEEDQEAALNYLTGTISSLTDGTKQALAKIDVSTCATPVEKWQRYFEELANRIPTEELKLWNHAITLITPPPPEGDFDLNNIDKKALLKKLRNRETVDKFGEHALRYLEHEIKAIDQTKAFASMDRQAAKRAKAMTFVMTLEN